MCHHCPTLATNSRSDPTNTAGLRRKAFADIRKRLNGAYKDVRDLVESLPYTTTEVPQDQIRNRRVYKYDLTDRDTDAEIWRIIEEWFETGGDPPNRWVLGQFVSEAYRSGTGQAASRLRSLAEQAQALSLAELGQLEAEAVLTSRPVRERIDKVYRRMFEEMVGFTGDTANDLARTLSDGVARGVGVRTIKGDIKKRFGVAESRAQRIARTELGQSYRGARREVAVDSRDRLGLNVMQQWVSALAPTTRASHAARHLNFYTPEQNAAFYSVDGNSINCILPGTEMAGQFVAGSKAHYRGEIVKIVTAGGRNLSVTINHPIMTDRGLVAAAELIEGDNLVADRGKVKNPVRVPALDNNLTDARIENVFGALVELGHSLYARVRGVDFHGDGAGMDEDVNIVNVKRPLKVAIDAAGSKLLKHFSLVKADSPLNRMKAMGSLLARLDSIGLAASRLVRSRYNALVVFIGGLRESLRLGFGHIPGVEALVPKSTVNNAAGNADPVGYGENGFSGVVSLPRGVNIEMPDLVGHRPSIKPRGDHALGDKGGVDSEIIRDLLHGFSGVVELDQIVSVEKEFFAGHVYDLQEVSGLMYGNGILMSNCLCVQQEVMLSQDNKIIGERKWTKRDRNEVEELTKKK